MAFEICRLYERNPDGSRRIVELVSHARGERLVRMGMAERGVDYGGTVTCYFVTRCTMSAARARALALGVRGCTEIVAVASCAALSRREVDAIAGTGFKFGKSRTAGMSEEKRVNRMNPRTHRILPAEDLVERAQAKLDAWGRIAPAVARIVNR